MTKKTFNPEIAEYEGAEGYVRYCSGLGILQQPEAWRSIHNQADIEGNIDSVLVTAEHLILSGSRKFIDASAGLSGITNFTEAKTKFDEVAPTMYRLLGRVCESQFGRLQEINTAYPIVRPAPFLDRTTYRYIAGGDYSRIHFSTMLDDMVPAEVLRERLENRSFSRWPSGLRIPRLALP